MEENRPYPRFQPFQAFAQEQEPPPVGAASAAAESRSPGARHPCPKPRHTFTPVRAEELSLGSPASPKGLRHWRGRPFSRVHHCYMVYTGLVFHCRLMGGSLGTLSKVLPVH